MERGTRHAAPLVRLAPAVSRPIDRDVEPSQLPAEPPVLLPPAREIRLDYQQVQVAVRPSLAPRPRPEENDIGLGGSCREPASSLLDQSLIGHRHNFRS